MGRLATRGEKERLIKDIVNTANRYRKVKPMTLIIGARFHDGIILVSDRKITNETTGKESWENKLKVPIDFPLAFGASGYSHKFKQFNRKILETIDERAREVVLANIAHRKKLGIIEPPLKTRKRSPQKLNTKEIETAIQKEKEIGDNVDELYKYSIEGFIEDCQFLIKKLCTDTQTNIIYPHLDVLLALMGTQGARLHHLNYAGEEEEVDYCAIGSGASYVNLFLEKFWSEGMSIEQIIKLAYFCIYYVQDIDFDRGVGMEPDILPDHIVITHGGLIGNWTGLEKGKDKIISEIKENVGKFKTDFVSVRFVE